MKLTCHGAKARALKIVKWLLKFTKTRLNTVKSGLVERLVSGFLLLGHMTYIAVGTLLDKPIPSTFEEAIKATQNHKEKNKK